MPTPDRTSLPAIVAAGRELLEHAGPSGVTMQAVATKVGVRAPSLYKRVRDRDALITAVAASVIEDLAVELERTEADRVEKASAEPDTMDPDEAERDGTDNLLARLAKVYRSFAHAHPEAFRLMFTASTPLDALERAAAPVLAAVRDFAGDDEALNAARLVTAWMTGFLQMELAGAFRLGGDVDDAFDYGLDRLLDGLRSG